MKLYVRILSFLKPHTPLLVAAVAATFVFAILDAAVYVLLIPFVQALFVSGGAGFPTGGSTTMGRLLDATVYRWVVRYTKKAKKLLGWHPRIPMDESLERLFAYMRGAAGTK